MALIRKAFSLQTEAVFCYGWRLKLCKATKQPRLVPLRSAGALWLGTDYFEFKLTGAETQGPLLVAELTARPQFAPPAHIHHHEDESYYVLNGEFEFMSGGVG